MDTVPRDKDTMDHKKLSKFLILVVHNTPSAHVHTHTHTHTM